MTRRALPIGIQTFRKIREGDFYYVDKTGFALRLIAEGSHYFLSRPRRFGKSLFLDTLAELFEGNAALFGGLEAERCWDWSRRFPVIRLSFAEGVLDSRQALGRRIEDLIRINRDTLAVNLYPDLDISGQFGELIRAAHAHFGERVVVLVDEYDKPILDNITDPATARQMRDGLRNLYSVIKGQDAHIRFAFLTGVSKFPPSAATPRRTSIGPSRQSWKGSIEHRSAPGTTATTGSARQSTIRSMCCCCSRSACFIPGGSRPARRPFWSRC
jgi:hypothetical protein